MFQTWRVILDRQSVWPRRCTRSLVQGLFTGYVLVVLWWLPARVKRVKTSSVGTQQHRMYRRNATQDLTFLVSDGEPAQILCC